MDCVMREGVLVGYITLQTAAYFARRNPAVLGIPGYAYVAAIVFSLTLTIFSVSCDRLNGELVLRSCGLAITGLAGYAFFRFLVKLEKF